MIIKRVKEGLAWRYRSFTRRAARKRYLRRTFANGDALTSSYLSGTSCEQAVCRDGVIIRHPPGRSALAQMLLEVWFDEVYTGQFYRPEPGDTVIDAGANIGLFTLLIGRRQPRARVLAFEPFGENYQLLCENVAAAGLTNVVTVHAALSDSSGTAHMIAVGDRSQDHRLAAPDSGPVSTPVRTCSLSEALALAESETVALLKCDIEGAERDVFGNVTPEQLLRIEKLAIEYHDNIRPGTLDMLQATLTPTHVVTVRSESDAGYGMLYAIKRSARS